VMFAVPAGALATRTHAPSNVHSTASQRHAHFWIPVGNGLPSGGTGWPDFKL
jgi:hypothetical protein